MNFGKKIIKYRKEKGISQEKLSEIIGVTRQTISNWESDITSPDLKQTKKLSEVFDVSIDELTGSKNNFLKNKFTKREVIYIIVLVIIFIVSIILLTKRDYTNKYQTEIYCRLGKDNIIIGIEINENKEYVINYTVNKKSEEIYAGDTIDDAFKSLETSKKVLIKNGAFCK